MAAWSKRPTRWSRLDAFQIDPTADAAGAKVSVGKHLSERREVSCSRTISATPAQRLAVIPLEPEAEPEEVDLLLRVEELALGARGGVAFPYARSERVPVHERFFAGGGQLGPGIRGEAPGPQGPGGEPWVGWGFEVRSGSTTAIAFRRNGGKIAGGSTSRWGTPFRMGARSMRLRARPSNAVRLARSDPRRADGRSGPGAGLARAILGGGLGPVRSPEGERPGFAGRAVGPGSPPGRRTGGVVGWGAEPPSEF